MQGMGDGMNRYDLPVFIGVLLVVGAVFLFFPRAIQRYAARSVAQGLTAKAKWPQRFIASNAYIWNVRIVGIGAVAMGVALLFLRFGASGK